MRDRVSNEHSMFERILLALFMANCMQVLVVFRCSIDSTVHRRLQTLSELTFLSCEFFATVISFHQHFHIYPKKMCVNDLAMSKGDN